MSKLSDRSFVVKSKKERYRAKHLQVVEFTVERDGARSKYPVIQRQDSVVIIPTTADGRYLLLRQYRFPTEDFSWELPMGGIRSKEIAADAAARELAEETNLTTPLVEVGHFRPVPGLTPQRVAVYATTIPPLDDASLAMESADPDDIVERRQVSPRELDGMIAAGSVTDGFTLCALAIYWSAGHRR